MNEVVLQQQVSAQSLIKNESCKKKKKIHEKTYFHRTLAFCSTLSESILWEVELAGAAIFTNDFTQFMLLS